MNINIVWITCDICVFDILGLDKDNLNYNIYPLVTGCYYLFIKYIAL